MVDLISWYSIFGLSITSLMKIIYNDSLHITALQSVTSSCLATHRVLHYDIAKLSPSHNSILAGLRLLLYHLFTMFMMTYFWLPHDLFTACSWFAHDLFITCSWLVHDSSWLLHNFLLTCLWPVHNTFTIFFQHLLFISSFEHSTLCLPGTPLF